MSDDILSLPRRGESAAQGPGGASSAAGPVAQASSPGGLRHPELLGLSSEARLATALLLQAQALDGLHRAHVDVLSRLDDGPAVAELRQGIDELRRDLVARLAREQRRVRRRRLIGGVLAVLGIAVAAVVVIVDRQHLGAALDELRLAVAGGTPVPRAEIEDAVAVALQRASADQAAALGEIGRTLDRSVSQARAEIDRLGAERDGLQRDVATARGEAQALRDSQARQEQDLAATRDERNRQIGENALLRQQLMDRDRRLDEVGVTLESVRADQAARAGPPTASISTSPTGQQGLPARASAALRASGAEETRVLEAGGVEGGELRDVVVARPGRDPAEPRLVTAASAALVSQGGRAFLRLRSAVTAGAEATEPADEDVELPALDADAWRALGLALPADLVPLPRVQDALGELLAPFGYRVTGLGSFDGQRFGGLELRQDAADGFPARTLRAAEGTLLPVGPELELHDGTIATGDDVRPFFHGVYRLPLPGADYGVWLARLAGPGPSGAGPPGPGP